MSAQSELRSPASSDSPILPAPRIAILIDASLRVRRRYPASRYTLASPAHSS